jgi:hypothetical protein
MIKTNIWTTYGRTSVARSKPSPNLSHWRGTKNLKTHRHLEPIERSSARIRRINNNLDKKKSPLGENWIYSSEVKSAFTLSIACSNSKPPKVSFFPADPGNSISSIQPVDLTNEAITSGVA